MGDWVTVKEATDILNVSERTVRRYVAKQKIKSRLEDGRRLIYVNCHDSVMPTNTHDNFDILLQEKNVHIQQLEEQVERLTQLLDMAQKSIDRLTEQNQLLLKDIRNRFNYEQSTERSLWRKAKTALGFDSQNLTDDL